MLYFLIACAVVLVLMVIIKAISNGVDKAAENKKNERDRAVGAYNVSAPERLADRFKKE